MADFLVAGWRSTGEICKKKLTSKKKIDLGPISERDPARHPPSRIDLFDLGNRQISTRRIRFRCLEPSTRPANALKIHFFRMRRASQPLLPSLTPSRRRHSYHANITHLHMTTFTHTRLIQRRLPTYRPHLCPNDIYDNQTHS